MWVEIDFRLIDLDLGGLSSVVRYPPPFINARQGWWPMSGGPNRSAHPAGPLVHTHKDHLTTLAAAGRGCNHRVPEAS